MNIWIICVILAILNVVLMIYYPKFRGFMGEFWVKKELNSLPNNRYIILNDIMIEDEMGTHQIDHIVISQYGIFVIEMKNYYGLITGDEYHDKWCQYTRKSKHYFKNPIHQNYGHIKSLAKLLNINDNLFIPIVCFSNQARLNIKARSTITQTALIKKIILDHQNIIINEDIMELKNKILLLNIVDKRKRKAHVENIRTKIQIAKNLEDNMVCPKCGCKLILKNGKYGNFVGCSNFPKCKYIKK